MDAQGAQLVEITSTLANITMMLARMPTEGNSTAASQAHDGEESVAKGVGHVRSDHDNNRRYVGGWAGSTGAAKMPGRAAAAEQATLGTAEVDVGTKVNKQLMTGPSRGFYGQPSWRTAAMGTVQGWDPPI